MSGLNGEICSSKLGITIYQTLIEALIEQTFPQDCKQNQAEETYDSHVQYLNSAANYGVHCKFQSQKMAAHP